MRYCLNHCARPGTLWLSLGLLAMILTSGCGSGLVQVSGTVHVGDEPVTDGYVSFVPAKGGGASATAKIDSSGKYVMGTLKEGDGLAPGEYLVTVAGGETPAHRDQQGKFRDAVFKTPAKYRDPKTSGLTAKVEKGSPQTFDFRLEP